MIRLACECSAIARLVSPVTWLGDRFFRFGSVSVLVKLSRAEKASSTGSRWVSSSEVESTRWSTVFGKSFRSLGVARNALLPPLLCCERERPALVGRAGRLLIECFRLLFLSSIAELFPWYCFRIRANQYNRFGLVAAYSCRDRREYFLLSDLLG